MNPQLEAELAIVLPEVDRYLRHFGYEFEQTGDSRIWRYYPQEDQWISLAANRLCFTLRNQGETHTFEILSQGYGLNYVRRMPGLADPLILGSRALWLDEFLGFGRSIPAFTKRPTQ
jgi:hypothetical protein